MVKKVCSVLLAAFLLATGVFWMNKEAEAARKLRMGSHYVSGYFLNEGFKRINERIKQATNGEIEIVMYENSSLGSYEQMLQEVMRGTLDMQAAWGTPRFNKQFEILATPGLAAGWEQVYKLTSSDSPFTAYLKQIYGEIGTVYIGSLVDSLSAVAIRKAKTIEHPYDKSNKECTIRVVDFAASRAWWKAMGYQIASTQYAELFSAMQTGVVDGDMGAGMESTYLRYRDVVSALYEIPNEFWLLDLVVSKKLWDSLDDKTKQIFIDAFEAERESVYEAAKASWNDYKQKLIDSGIKIVSPTPEEIKFMNQIAFDYAWPEAEKVLDGKALQAIREYLGN
ncbi:MAG: TRAP transporter substrate-binding protein DctP [Synergistaceae bacterium]|nr:TRAP transporter substrate-binding protein DctP [Synergistaceae bacterium]